MITPFPAYAGPKAKIAVTDFEVKSNKVSAEIVSGFKEMFVKALKDTNRFLVELAPADLIISLAVTEFEPQASGGRAGVGGGGGVGRGLLGGLLGNTENKARITLDIRIVDVSTSKVLAVTDVQAQAQDTEKAMRISIIEAVRYISRAVPGKFYRYANNR
jgi:curli biogenesis system outer membrane secretion channel CsgG